MPSLSNVENAEDAVVWVSRSEAVLLQCMKYGLALGL